jgi:hypothetical protein
MIMKDKLLRYSAAAVLAHALVSVPHGLAHAQEQAYLPRVATAFVIVVIVLAPFVALGLLRLNKPRVGALLLFGSMLGALLFGITFHYLLPGADNVAHVPAGSWQLPFQLTSALLVAVEAAGVVVGGWGLYVISHRPVQSAERI